MPNKAWFNGLTQEEHERWRKSRRPKEILCRRARTPEKVESDREKQRAWSAAHRANMTPSRRDEVLRMAALRDKIRRHKRKLAEEGPAA